MKINTVSPVNFGQSEKINQNIFDLECKNALNQMNNADEYLTRIKEINFVERCCKTGKKAGINIFQKLKKIFVKSV